MMKAGSTTANESTAPGDRYGVAPQHSEGEDRSRQCQDRARATATKGNNQALDGVRTVAVLLVLLFHGGAPLSGAGWLGVDLFFVLSGFLITTLLLKEYQKKGRICLRLFWARRFLRLMPIYMLYVLGITLAVHYGPPGERQTYAGWTPGQLLLCLWTYLGNLPPLSGIWKHQHLTHHLWSLSVEEQFYFFWPLLLIALIALRRIERVAWGLVLVVFSANLLLYGGTPPTLLIHARGIGLLIGCATAITVHQRAAVLERTRLLSRAAGGLACVGLGLVYVAITFVSIRYRYDASRLLPLGVPAFDLCAGWLIANLWVLPRSGTAQWLSRWPLPQIGAVSYGAYLYHMLAWSLVWRHLTVSWEGMYVVLKFGLRMALFVGLTVAMAQLSYRTIERPFLRLKDRLR